MAVLRDKEEEKGQGTSQALGQPVAGQMQSQEVDMPQQAQSSGPTTIGGSSAAQTPSTIKAMPKQQKAGTGTFANLKSYLQAAQGGGQQKVAQAATQQVQRLGTTAQKGIQQAQESFKGQLGAGSGAIFQGTQPGQYLKAEDVAKQAQDTTKSILDTAAATTFQTPQAQTAGETATTTQAPIPQTQQYFKPEDLEAFSNVFNAQYQGPASLQQAGLYEQVAKKARTAQQAGELTQTSGGREQLLRDVFGRSRDYSRGASRLDALLLNASEQGVQQLQQQAQPALQSQQALQAAQNLSTNEAAQRAAAIEDIRSGTRTAFTKARTAEEESAQKYITDIQDQWNKLPEYFKDVLTQAKTSTGGVALSSEEAALLGLQGGQSLFGVTPESIQAAPKALGEEIITKDQLSRQLALAELANLDKIGGLDKAPMYSNLEKAGTKNLLNSLNVESLQKDLAEREQAAIDKLALINNRIGSKVVTTPYGVGSEVLELRGGGYNLGDLVKNQGGYQTIDSGERAKASEDFLKALAEDPTVTRSSTSVPDIIETIKSNLGYDPTLSIGDPSSATISRINAGDRASRSQLESLARNLVTQNWQSSFIDPIKKAGFTRDVELVENEQTAARSQALRELLAGIYKK